MKIMLACAVWFFLGMFIAWLFGRWKKMDEPERPENLMHEGYREADDPYVRFQKFCEMEADEEGVP